MQLTNPLLHALLAACDQSYNPAPTQGQALTPYLDTPGGDPVGNYWPAMWPTADLDGWKEAKRFDEPGTGFGAVVYQKSAGNGKFDYIVALQGTRGPNAQDWHGNLTYGWEKWLSVNKGGGQELMSFLLSTGDHSGDGILSSTNQISFTGQSLGGALAQYAAYQYVDQRNNVLQKPVSSSDVSLTSFNGLGGLEALNKNYEKDFGRPFTGDLLAGVATAHYWITNDLVSALGGGHLNGHEYRLDFRAESYPDDSTNTIDAVSGNNIIYGSGGRDTFFVGSGNDTIFTGNGEQSIEGGSGKSVIYSGIGINTLAGNARIAMLCTNDMAWRKTA